MSKTKDDTNGSFMVKHPVLFMAGVLLYCILFARGDSSLMGPVDMFFVTGGFGAFCLYVAKAKIPACAISGVAIGMISALSCLLGADNNLILSAGGTVIIAGSLIYLRIKGSFDHDQLIHLILAMGFWLMFCYSQYTPCWLRQNDVGFFGETVFDPHHAGYISYIRYYGWIPAADVREMDQWYHPPFHHLICAYFLRLYGMVFPKYAQNYDVLQMFTTVYSMLTVVFMRRIVKMFGLTDRTDLTMTLMMAVFPFFVFNAGELNNDILSILLFVMSVYFIFRWYREGRKMVHVVLSALTIGLGMMTKLSVWMAAVPVGIILLAVLIEKKGKDLKLWGQYGIFALISFPLGLWFPIRNYLGWGVPPTYIPVPFYDSSLEKYSVWQRLFDVFDNSGYCNIPYFAVWSAVFDDDDYRVHMFFGTLSFIIFTIVAFLAIAAFIGVIYLIIRTVRKREYTWEIISLTALLAVELISFTIFCFKFPFICTMNFRYIVPVLIPLFLGAGVLRDRIGRDDRIRILGTITDISVVAVSVMSYVFYISLWYYDMWLELQNL